MSAVPEACPGCGQELPAGASRFAITVEVVASLGDADRELDPEAEEDGGATLRRLLAELEKCSSHELQDGVWQKFAFALCPACKRRFLDELRTRFAALKY